MPPCDKPVGEMALREALNCAWDKGANALSVVVHNPGSATIADWAIAFLAALMLLNFALLVLDMLMPPRRFP
ncbi:MAG TPA: hypothetical protein VEH76_02060 [Methylocystis sp.]|nr:hypothetical protein [Methylocystis sp.]